MSVASRDSIHDAVLATLAWFDVFDYPLTMPEVCRFLPAFGNGIHGSADAVSEALGHEGVGSRDGYYFLVGREANVETRRRRYRIARHKLAHARRAAAAFAALPSVRMVALCNSLAVSNAEEGSDIDFLVVCRPGTLWTTRLLLGGSVKLLGLQPTADNQRDRLCLSFFVSSDALDLRRVALPEGDPYMKFWIAALMPLRDKDGLFDAFRRANAWAFGESSDVAQFPRTPLAPFDAAARHVQLWHFPRVIRELANTDSRVVITDHLLKFHVNDRRAVYRDTYRERLAQLGISGE